MKAYLIEEYTPKLKFEKDSTIIALTPKACYDLDKFGIKHSIIEDYYNREDLLNQDDEYFQFQLKWIDSLDNFLQRNIPNLKKYDLKPSEIYFYFLKTMVMDSLYIICYQLLKLVDRLKPKHIVFATSSYKEEDFDFQLRHYITSYFYEIIPILCKEKNIDLDIVTIKKQELETKYNNNKSSNEIIEGEIRKKLAKIKFFRDLYFFTKYGKHTLFNKKTRKDLNLLLLKTGHNAWEIVKDGLKRKHNIFLLKENKIMKYSSFGEKTYYELNNKDKNSLKIPEDILEKLKNSQLIKQFNHQCKLDASDILFPKLEHFILKIVPELYNYYLGFVDFYEKEKIDFVITPHRTSPIEFSAIAAANNCENVKSVGVDHGHDVFIKNYWHNSEMKNYNIYICFDNEIKNYLNHLCAKKGHSTNIKCSSHKFLDIQKIKHMRSMQKKDADEKVRIIYLPTMFHEDCVRMESNVYPDAWYYKFQKELIEFFSNKKEFIFVWKGIPASDAVYNPIPDFIKDKKFSNIKIATNPFREHLLSADMVICDYPSTGFYESLIAGIPTISLYHKNFKIRNTAKKYFGEKLKPFSTTSDAIDIIKKFLNSKPQLYMESIDTEDKNVIEILETI